MQKWIRSLSAVALLCATGAHAEPAGDPSRPGPSDAQPRTAEQKIIYALGVQLAQGVADYRMSDAELELLRAGFRDTLYGHPPKAALPLWVHRIPKLQQRRREVTARENRAASKAFLAEARAAQGAVRRASGLIYRELEPGEGPQAKAGDRVRVHYTGKHIDGSVFEATERAKRPAELALDSVIRCWSEGVEMMRVGGRSELVCPPEIAYGLKGVPGKIEPGSTLVFEIELVGIAPAPAAPTN